MMSSSQVSQLGHKSAQQEKTIEYYEKELRETTRKFVRAPTAVFALGRAVSIFFVMVPLPSHAPNNVKGSKTIVFVYRNAHR